MRISIRIIHVPLKTFQVESLFLWAFVLVLVRRMTAAATAAVANCAMYWEGLTRANTKAQRIRLSTSKVFTCNILTFKN